MTAVGLSRPLGFERSEYALGLVNQTAARFARETSERSRTGSLFVSRLLSPRAARSAWLPAWNVFRIEDALSRLLAIAEEFTFGLLVELTERQLPSDALVATLWEEHVNRETDTWEQRLGAWNRLHEVAIASEFPRHEPLQGFIQARNAIVHGLGVLTRKQTNTPKRRNRTISRLGAADIFVTTGDRLVLSVDHVAACASVIRSFIEWLDGAAAATLRNGLSSAPTR